MHNRSPVILKQFFYGADSVLHRKVTVIMTARICSRFTPLERSPFVTVQMAAQPAVAKTQAITFTTTNRNTIHPHRNYAFESGPFSDNFKKKTLSEAGRPARLPQSLIENILLWQKVRKFPHIPSTDVRMLDSPTNLLSPRFSAEPRTAQGLLRVPW
jgi:hypothetical protein